MQNHLFNQLARLKRYTIHLSIKVCAVYDQNRLTLFFDYEPINRYNRLMKTYNWQQPDWPNFQYDILELHEILLSISEKMGSITGKLAHLTENLQTEA